MPGTNIEPDTFWKGFSEIANNLAPINRKLIEKRESIQKQLDEWHINNKSQAFDKNKYKNFLKSISYIVEEKEDFNIETEGVDDEIALIAGPQLVVPVDNARYALNAANARWGSLYDALYGTDVIQGDKSGNYSPERGNKVILYVREFLNQSLPLIDCNWKEIDKIMIDENEIQFF